MPRPVCAAGSTVPDYVDITRDNFEEVFPMVERALKSCSFYAMDCEMTGLFLNENKEEFLDDYQDRYQKLSMSAQQFLINQFGLSVFHQVDGSAKGYTASTFNFYIFPHPSEGDSSSLKFMSDAGSLAFLASQGFDFNKWIYKGVPYMSLRDKERRMQQIRQSDTPRNEVTPTKQEDIQYVADLVITVNEWMAGPETSLRLPQVNSYQRLLAYQELSKPQFGVEGRSGFFIQKLRVDGWTVLNLVKGTEEEVKAMEAEELKERIRALNEAASFARVFELMSKCGKPAVGHNCLLDVLYSLSAFAEPTLPKQWEDFKKLVSKWFPSGIYDTKHLARELPELFDQMGSSTSLGDVYKGLMKDGPQRSRAEQMVAALSSMTDMPISMPSVVHAAGFEKYKEMEAGGAAHEAGYDAFMTGSVFASLMPLVHAKNAIPEEQLSLLFSTAGESPIVEPPPSSAGDWDMQMYNPWQYVSRYMGRLNIGRTDIPYMALFGSDPALERPNVYHVSGLPPGTYVSDVIKRFQAAELGRVRVTMLEPGSAYIEVDPNLSEALRARIQDGSLTQEGYDSTNVQVVSFKEHSKQRLRSAGAENGTCGGGGHCAAVRSENVYSFRPTKRLRPGDFDSPGPDPGRRWCSIM